MQTPTHITLPVTTEDPDALFLRQGLATGSGSDGSEVELDITGSTLLMTVKLNGEKVVQSLGLADLAAHWATLITMNGDQS